MNTDIFTKTIYLDKGKVKEGYNFVADKIYHDSGSAGLRAESFPALEHLFDFMKNNTGVEIEIAGQTDNLFGYRHCMGFSVKRTESVAESIKTGTRLKDTVIQVQRPRTRERRIVRKRRVEITVKSSRAFHEMISCRYDTKYLPFPNEIKDISAPLQLKCTFLFVKCYS